MQIKINLYILIKNSKNSLEIFDVLVYTEIAKQIYLLSCGFFCIPLQAM
jgi:hypothetical protein